MLKLQTIEAQRAGGIFQLATPESIAQEAQAASARSSSISMLLWGAAILGGGGLLLYALTRK